MNCPRVIFTDSSPSLISSSETPVSFTRSISFLTLRMSIIAPYCLFGVIVPHFCRGV